MTRKIKKCEKCKGLSLRAYIRIKKGNKRKWVPIGYYCTECFHFFE